jgi:hypothetical protein
LYGAAELKLSVHRPNVMIWYGRTPFPGFFRLCPSPVPAVRSMIWPFGRSADPITRHVYISVIKPIPRAQQNEKDTARIYGLGGPVPKCYFHQSTRRETFFCKIIITVLLIFSIFLNFYMGILYKIKMFKCLKIIDG